MKPDTTQPPSAGNVLAFPPAGARPVRREAAAGEARGEILLFLGVRYERLPEPEAVPAPRRCRS
ncbi:hypothetical protein U8607_03290 [Methylobacterium durans]|uniref:hypothetical protein n=1 Tax=Methylobacterium durans TaxID=2202825 RepID=UPI002AFEDF79|nr:hypothetical protein [Methylobacterium durans]MEA1831097.1 hypothetical protein [Methylobacterium durans]